MNGSSFNKTFVLIIIISAIAMFAPPIRSALAGILNSKHDFAHNAGTPFGSGYVVDGSQSIDEICVFCHTPHGASKTNLGSSGGYLWNRTGPVGAQYGYSLYTSATLTMISLGTAPTGITLMCLSCHDGLSSIAVGVAGDNLLNRPGSGGDVTRPDDLDIDYLSEMYYENSPFAPNGWGPNIGNQDFYAQGSPINLSNDHPVSFDWMDNIPGINDKGAIFNSPSTLKLFNNRMECSTCHNVHDNTTAPPFLRMKNDNSNMCLKCHNK